MTTEKRGKGGGSRSAENIMAQASGSKKILQSEENLKIYLQNAPDGVFISDLKDAILYANKKVEEITGYSREELLGHSFLNLKILPSSNIARATDLAKINQSSKPTGPDEFELIRKDGGRIWVDISTTPITKQGIVAVIGFIRDITERKQSDEKIKRSFDRLQSAMQGTIRVMSMIVELRDPYTAGHQFRVTKLACAIAEEMKLPAEQIDGIRAAGIVHDIGKIHVPSEILSKPGHLSEVEFIMIKTHPKIGYDILKQIEFPWPVADIVLQHHERMDGSGYPSGTSGENICMEARILAVADVIEAIASHRPYRAGLGMVEALKEISQSKSNQYDSRVTEACLKLFNEKGFNF